MIKGVFNIYITNFKDTNLKHKNRKENGVLTHFLTR